MSKCEHDIQKKTCRICSPHNFCVKHNKVKRNCPDPECGGGQNLCIHGKQKASCTDCKGGNICDHGISKSKCKVCGGASMCVHGNQKYQCTTCGTGRGVCPHGKNKHHCKVCSPHHYCIHGSEKRRCKICPIESSPAATSADQLT